MKNSKFDNHISFLKRGFSRGCVISVLVLFLFFAVMSIHAAATGRTEPGINFATLSVIIVFSLIVSYAHEIFSVTSLPMPGRYAVNFIIVGLAFFFVFLRSKQFSLSAGGYFVGIVLYAFIYALISLIVYLVGRKKKPTEKTKLKTKKEEKNAYQSMFD